MKDNVEHHTGTGAPEARAPAAAWYMLFVVTLILIVGMIDRLSLTLLVEPIKKDLHVSDLGMSFLLGLSFALPFTALGLPAGHLADKYPRRLLMAVGGLVWTLMTFASGLAQTYEWLFVCRAGVGLGEAILTPCAYSMIRDAFPAREHPMAFGLHNIGGPLGNGLALIVVGGLVGMGNLHLPAGLNTLATWRAALCVVGLGGLSSLFLLLTIAEPRRRSDLVTGVEDAASVRATAQHLRSRWPIYASLFAGTGVFGIATLGIGVWLPTALARLFQQPIDHIAQPLGLIQIVAPIAGLGTAVMVLTKSKRRTSIRVTAYAGAVVSVLMAIALTTSLLSPSLRISWIAITVVWFFHPWSGLVCATILAWITPGRMMGKITSINFLMLGLVGMIGGPTLIPIVAGSLFKGPAALSYGLLVCAGAAYLLAAVALSCAAANSDDRKAIVIAS